MSFQKKRITFECDEATHMKIQSLLGNKTYLNTKRLSEPFFNQSLTEHMKTSKESNSSKQTYKIIKDKLNQLNAKRKYNDYKQLTNGKDWRTMKIVILQLTKHF